MDSISLDSLLTRAPNSVDDGVHNFTDQRSDYCANFGDQWNRFREIQLDSCASKSDSRERFFSETGWTADEISGKVLLDAGCGAGRFAEVAMNCGARVVAVDLSSAVYACRLTLNRFSKDDYLVLRADLFDLPLKKGSFDGIYSLGVLQHTPDPLGAISHLARLLRPGGRLATWVYEKRSPDISWLQPRTWLRGILAHQPNERKLAISRALTTVFFPAGWTLSWLGRTGERLSQFLPYAARHHLAKGDLRRQWTYSVMDTFDWYGPVYDQPQREADLINAMKMAGLTNVQRQVARGMAITGEALSAPQT
jgi:SAM-dependent methyltransferase